MLPWFLCAALALAAAALAAKVWVLQKSMDGIVRQLTERLAGDTNNLLFLSTRDRHVRELAVCLNAQLKELRRQRLQYESGNRKLKQAVTDVSHDLRTPLTAICGYLELLERQEMDKDAARYLAQIDSRIQTMIELSEEMLRYASSGEEAPLKKEPVDLNAAAQASVAALYASFIARGITPCVSLPPEKVVRMLDKAALTRVLENLLSNALKYSDGDVSVSLTADGEFTCTNSAPGLDEVKVGRMFDRFFTVQTGRASTGLGLSIARTLTERMGGEIRARYDEGRLSISVRFPKRDGVTGGAASPPLVPEATEH